MVFPLRTGRDENCQLINGLSFYYLDGRVYDPKWFIMAIENLRFAGFFGLTTLDRPTFKMIDIIQSLQSPLWIGRPSKSYLHI